MNMKDIEEKLKSGFKISNDEKYKLLRRIMIENRVGRLSRDNIMVRYMQVINKVQTEEDLDNALIAIYLNEKSIKQTGKSAL